MMAWCPKVTTVALKQKNASARQTAAMTTKTDRPGVFWLKLAANGGDQRHVWKSVENLTSGAFVKMWQDRVDRFYTRYSEATTK
jgi:hypothetical protein